MTDKTIEIICDKAADKAVGKYIQELKNKKKDSKKSRLYNTRLLLENYRTIKMYAQNAESVLKKMDKESLAIPYDLMKFFGV